MVALRTTILLVFLAAVPTAAIIGTPMIQHACGKGEPTPLRPGRVVNTPRDHSERAAREVRIRGESPTAPSHSAGVERGENASEPVPAPAPPSVPPPAAVAGDAAPAPPADPFAELQRALRDMGATYYILETWGERGELYRFECQVSGAEPAGTRQQFVAVHRDALAAVERVYDQVAAWHDSQPNPSRTANQ